MPEKRPSFRTDFEEILFPNLLQLSDAENVFSITDLMQHAFRTQKCHAERLSKRKIRPERQPVLKLLFPNRFIAPTSLLPSEVGHGSF